MSGQARDLYAKKTAQINELVAAGSLSEYDANQERIRLFDAYSKEAFAEALRMDQENEAAAAQTAALQAAQIAALQAAQTAARQEVAPANKPTSTAEDRQAELEQLLGAPVLQSRDPKGHAAWQKRVDQLLEDEASE